MKKLVAAVLISLVGISSAYADDKSDMQKCNTYENGPEAQVSAMVKGDLLKQTQVPAQRYAIQHMNFSQVLRAGYSLYCGTPFEKKNVLNDTLGNPQLMVP